VRETGNSLYNEGASLNTMSAIRGWRDGIFQGETEKRRDEMRPEPGQGRRIAASLT
jgi:hypothetical protein